MTTDAAGLDEAACTAAVKAVRWASDEEWRDRPTIIARILTAGAPHIRKAALSDCADEHCCDRSLVGDAYLRGIRMGFLEAIQSVRNARRRTPWFRLIRRWQLQRACRALRRAYCSRWPE